MAVTEGALGVGETTSFLDTTIVTQDDGTLAHREGVFLGDPEHADRRLLVKPVPSADDNRIGTHDAETYNSLLNVNREIRDELKMIRIFLEGIAQ